MSSAVEPLKYSDFKWLWGGNVISASGTFVQSVSASWLMFELTGSSTWVGLIVASATLPLLFFSLTAGALADRFKRSNLMLIAQGTMGISAAAMAVLTFMDLITPGLLLALGLLLGTGLALNIPAWQALVPDLVPRGLIASAVALNSAAFNAARAIGPAIGGGLVALYGAEAGFAYNALSYVAIVVALIVIGPHLAARLPHAPQPMRTAIAAGIRFARFTPAFRNLVVLVALFALGSAVVQAMLPVHTEYLGGGAVAFGILYGAMGVGALIGVMLRPRMSSWISGSWVPYTITAFGVSGLVIAFAPNLVVAGAGMLLCGLFWLLTLATLNATAQLLAPAWIRGRAMSIHTLAFAGMLPIGSIASGVVAEYVGTPVSLAIFSSGVLVLGLLAPRFRIPDVDDISSPEFSEQQAPVPLHDPDVGEGGPVIVLNTWKIREADLAQFIELMNQVRLVRLTTGAYRWRLFRNASDPTRLTELMALHSWKEHLGQHQRLNDVAVALLGQARDFDIDGGPITSHLIAIDIEDPPDFDSLVARHQQLHKTDGSIPRMDQEPGT